jgi:hypothetical protein
MKDYQAHLETLRVQAAEAALISDLATVPHKRELFAKLAAHFNMLAAEVERAMAAARLSAAGTNATGARKNRIITTVSEKMTIGKTSNCLFLVMIETELLNNSQLR